MVFRLRKLLEDQTIPWKIQITLKFRTNNMLSTENNHIETGDLFQTIENIEVVIPGCIQNCSKCFLQETPPTCLGCESPFVLHEGACITPEEHQELTETQQEEETQAALEEIFANEEVPEEEKLEEILKLLPEEEREQEVQLVEEITEIKEELVVIEERIEKLEIVKKEAQESVENTEQAAIKTTVVESTSQVVGTAIMKVSYASQLNVAALSAPGVSALQSTMTYTTGLKSYKGECVILLWSRYK
jgi:hypothetical protein